MAGGWELRVQGFIHREREREREEGRKSTIYGVAARRKATSCCNFHTPLMRVQANCHTTVASRRKRSIKLMAVKIKIYLIFVIHNKVLPQIKIISKTYNTYRRSKGIISFNLNFNVVACLVHENF